MIVSYSSFDFKIKMLYAHRKHQYTTYLVRMQFEHKLGRKLAARNEEDILSINALSLSFQAYKHHFILSRSPPGPEDVYAVYCIRGNYEV